MKDFTEAEDKQIEIELKRRSLESEVRKKEAEARKAEIENLSAELKLVQKLREAQVVIHRDNNGHLTILPAPKIFDYKGLADHLLSETEDVPPSEREEGTG